jgi:hypothetical protein
MQTDHLTEDDQLERSVLSVTHMNVTEERSASAQRSR